VTARPPAVAVLYDRDCGFCRWTVGALLRWDRHSRLHPVAIQSSEGERLLVDLSVQERLGSAHAVDAAGRRTSGGDAVGPVAAVLPGGAPLAALARRAPGAMRLAYGAVAGRRGLFGRLVSEAAKARADARIAQRAGTSARARV
jgi:predicted DCC family thiol-disulfide oxidoreductase YuxK